MLLTLHLVLKAKAQARAQHRLRTTTGSTPVSSPVVWHGPTVAKSMKLTPTLRTEWCSKGFSLHTSSWGCGSMWRLVLKVLAGVMVFILGFSRISAYGRASTGFESLRLGARVETSWDLVTGPWGLGAWPTLCAKLTQGLECSSSGVVVSESRSKGHHVPQTQLH